MAGRVSVTFIFILLTITVVIGVALPKPLHGGPSRKSNCINYLRMLDAAKEAWALEHGKTNADTPTWADIKEYLGRGGTEIPKCASGGTYMLGAMSNKPACSFPGHVLR